MKYLEVNHRSNPLGISREEIMFSFVGESKQYQFFLYEVDGKHPLYSRKVSQSESCGFYIDYELDSGKQYQWELKAEGEPRAAAWFETGIDFGAAFLQTSENSCPCFYKEFTVYHPTVFARLYITALGLYRVFLNGQRVGNSYLTPGYNDYDAYLRYQTYDVTDFLNVGENIVEVLCGDGWYKGGFGQGKKKNIYGSAYIVAAELVIRDSMGTTDCITTDENWRCRTTQILETSIYDGEVRDDRNPQKNLDFNVCKNEVWHVIPDMVPPICVKKILKPVLLISPLGEKILDFGQNMAGIVRFKVAMPAGTEIKLSFGEILQDRNFYNENYRTARAEYVYISDGKEKTVEPYFTFYGFRYVRVEGIEYVNAEDFQGLVLYSDLRETCFCRTDSPEINRLIENAVWSQRGNFIDIPTDCPQRDERLGWTGDAQVFSGTACFHMDCYTFYKKFMRDLRWEQLTYYNGDIPLFCPSLKGSTAAGGAVWADVATILPWNVYMHYGDKRLLWETYIMMREYVEVLIQKDSDNSHMMDSVFALGDWLALDGVTSQALVGATDKSFIKAVYYWNSVHLTSLAAKELGLEEEYVKLERLSRRIRGSVLDEFFTTNGRLAVDTQTGYALALYFGIYREKTRVVQGFRMRLAKDGYQIRTGFVGTPLLLPAMLENGMEEEAYQMLYDTGYPGWLYEVRLGATTIWERWNSVLEDGRISGTDMNSLNHYAYGSVCEAVYSSMAGLKCSSPAWKSAVIQPRPNWRMKKMDLIFDSPSGRYGIGWHLQKNGQIFVRAEIPSGVKADLYLPSFEEKECKHLKGGIYEYTYRPFTDYLHPFSIHTPICVLLDHAEAKDVLEKYYPEIFSRVTKTHKDFMYLSIAEMTAELPSLSIEEIERKDKFLRGIEA